MKLERLFFFIVLFFLIVLLCIRHGGTSYKTEIVTRDSVVVRYTYRDSVVYNVIKKDSIITDYTLVSVTEFDTVILHDTTYIAIPIASYHFADSLSDIWASGYRVTIDSVRYHFREVTKMVEREVLIKPRRLTADVGGMLIMTTDRWLLSADIRASARINDRWSVEACAGVAAGDNVMPFLGIGGRYSLR